MAKAGDDIWLGVEWDSATEGTNNGTVEGYTYFVPQWHSLEAKSCSFIRKSKLNFTKKMFEDALIEKYQQYAGVDKPDFKKL